MVTGFGSTVIVLASTNPADRVIVVGSLAVVTVTSARELAGKVITTVLVSCETELVIVSVTVELTATLIVSLSGCVVIVTVSGSCETV